MILFACLVSQSCFSVLKKILCVLYASKRFFMQQNEALGLLFIYLTVENFNLFEQLFFLADQTIAARKSNLLGLIVKFRDLNK